MSEQYRDLQAKIQDLPIWIRLPLRCLSLLVLLVILFGCLLPAVLMFFDVHFLPSSRWHSESAYYTFYAAAGSSLMALLFFCLMERVADHPSNGEFPLALIFVPFAFAFFGSAAIKVGVPMSLAVLAGDRTEMRFRVSDPDASSRRYCHSRVELHDMPFLFDSLCGVSGTFRAQLEPGDVIVVSGRGTDYGLLTEHVATLN